MINYFVAADGDTMLSQNSEEYQKIIALLYDISETLKSGLEIEKVFKPVLAIMSEHMGMHRGAITILNRKTGEIFIQESYGLSVEEVSRGRYVLGEGITGRVVESGQPAVIHKIGEEPDFLDKTRSRKNLEREDISFICVPIITSQGVIGTLSADKLFGEHLTLEEDLKLLSIIATMISRAVRLYQALHEEHLQASENRQRVFRDMEDNDIADNFIGNSSRMLALFGLIKKIAPTQTTVLILGESGVGKELVAQSIHTNSDRKNNPLVQFNCAALPENLIESELFGHEKGSFTGATATRVGKFQQAADGTIFLDEVGELSLSAQAKLLRVLQEKEIDRIGGTGTIKIDVRVIAATNKNLEELVEKGEFREDLFYRLDVFPITIPPLRERKTDIPLLADFFIDRYSRMNGKIVSRISTPAIDMLMSYHWPGNVRELENCIERAVILTDDETIHGYHLPPSLQKANPLLKRPSGNLQEQLDRLEYELIIEELKQCNGIMSTAAERLGLTVRQMGLRIDKYSIDTSRFKRVKTKR